MKLRRILFTIFTLVSLLATMFVSTGIANGAGIVDLAVKPIEFNTTPVAGSTFQLWVPVKNEGTASPSRAIGVRVKIYKDGQYVCTYDRQFEGLAPGQTKKTIHYFNLKESGKYQAHVYVDPYNLIPEKYEWNNTTTPYFNVTPAPKADLVVKVDPSKTSFNDGENIDFQLVVQNIGNAIAPAGSELWLYSQFGSGGYSMPGQMSYKSTLGSIAPGQSITLNYSNSFTYSQSVYAKIDNTNVITESNEANNSFGPIDLNEIMLPDLMVESFTYSKNPVNQYEQVNRVIVIKNQGDTIAPESWVRVPDVFFGGRGKSSQVKSLNPGESTIITQTIAFPATGTYTETAIADDTNIIAESNEANNSLNAEITIQ